MRGFRGDGATFYYSGNIDPNDLFFNMFMGGGFADFGMNENEFRNRYQRRRRNRQEPENRGPLAHLIQFMPIIMILSYLM